MQNQAETKTKQQREGSRNGVVEEETYSTSTTNPPMADHEVGRQAMSERFEKMRTAVSDLKARRDTLHAEQENIEQELHQINEAILRNEGALAMLQHLLQEGRS